MTRYFTILSNLRYLAIVAVTGAFLGSALMFLHGASDVIRAYLTFFGADAPEGELELKALQANSTQLSAS